MQIPVFRLSRRAPALCKLFAACGTLPAIGGHRSTICPCILYGLCPCRRDGCLMAGQAAARVCRNRHCRLRCIHSHTGIAARKCLAGAGQTAHILNVGDIADAGDLQRTIAA